MRDWIKAVGARTAYIEPGSPWENGYCESFNARFRDEPIDGEIFYGLREAQILIEKWRKHYNHQPYHESLNNVTPADPYFGRVPAIIKQRQRIKRQTIEYRRLQHRTLDA